MKQTYDLIGIGVGPFNLSLAALLEKTPYVDSLFLEKKTHFDWHPELMFADTTMQTTYMKDLVTPVDPTNPNSFLNYLVQNDLFYSFINTQRTVISRREFEQYCSWVAKRLQNKLQFDSVVQNIDFKNGEFEIESSKGIYHSKNICVATGLSPRLPECAKDYLGPQVFHAKSPELKNLNLAGKRLVIVGGGQTGIEIFRNAMLGKWGEAHSVQILTRRKNLEPLDEAAFTNEYFTPNYVDAFWNLKQDQKEEIIASQKLASDGNTPQYLSLLYNDLYRLKYVEGDRRPLQFLACRKLMEMHKEGEGFRLVIENTFMQREEQIQADVIILSTGFETRIPQALEPLYAKINFDSQGRFKFKKSYAIEWQGPEKNKIYALNFSRHNHGIIDPQTSLMAWRSANVINDLVQQTIFKTQQERTNFVDYGAATEGT